MEPTSKPPLKILVPVGLLIGYAAKKLIDKTRESEVDEKACEDDEREE